jgi:hypothetical protein
LVGEPFRECQGGRLRRRWKIRGISGKFGLRTEDLWNWFRIMFTGISGVDPLDSVTRHLVVAV